MKALTICQPWAWAIIAGHKNVENRTWPTNHRGPMLVHAGKARRMLAVEMSDRRDDWPGRYGVDLPDEGSLVFSALLGVVDVIDCVPSHQARGPWVDAGGFAWIIANVRPFAEPIPYRGQLGLFDVPDNLIR